MLLHAVRALRPSAAGVALELRTIKEHASLIKSHLEARHSSPELVDSVDKLATLVDQRNSLSRERDAALNGRKRASSQVGKLIKTDPDQAEALKLEATQFGEQASAKERELEAVEAQCRVLFEQLPNLLDDDTPDGASEDDNQVVLEWGEPLIGDFKWHDELDAGLDAEAASRLSGARFSVLKGPLARLERALTHFFLDLHAEHYEELSVPFIVSRTALEGTGQLPKFEDDLFKVSHDVRNEDAFLIPTAEVPLTNMKMGQLIDEADLPLNYVAATPCFRAEAGSYGRDTRGLFRQHQFTKVELVKIVTREQAYQAHADLVRDAEKCLQKLELPYRKVKLCAGDLGFSARLCFDLEVWLPGQQAYREISSCSLVDDFQSRRMGLRYRPKVTADTPKPKPQYPITMNGSGLAVGRTLVAVLENYQQPDGSIKVPDVLVPYMGGITYF